MLEVEDVLQVGAAPFVNRLVGVADDAQIAVPAGEALNEQVLRPVRVLVFVDHQEAELLAVPVANRLGLLEELDRLQQQVVEVEGVRVVQRLQVHPVQRADLLVARIPRRSR